MIQVASFEAKLTPPSLSSCLTFRRNIESPVNRSYIPRHLTLGVQERPVGTTSAAMENAEVAFLDFGTPVSL